MKTYKIRWSYRLERNIKANSRKEALAICDEMGDINANTIYLPMRIIEVIECPECGGSVEE